VRHTTAISFAPNFFDRLGTLLCAGLSVALFVAGGFLLVARRFCVRVVLSSNLARRKFYILQGICSPNRKID
jgi:hypothetical protein